MSMQKTVNQTGKLQSRQSTGRFEAPVPPLNLHANLARAQMQGRGFRFLQRIYQGSFTGSIRDPLRVMFRVLSDFLKV